MYEIHYETQKIKTKKIIVQNIIKEIDKSEEVIVRKRNTEAQAMLEEFRMSLKQIKTSNIGSEKSDSSGIVKFLKRIVFVFMGKSIKEEDLEKKRLL